MGLLSKGTPAEQPAKDQRKDDERFKGAWNAFWASPAGRARLAYRAGDELFQFALDVMNQEAIVKWMASGTGRGDRTRSSSVDPSAVLNSISREGWELVSAGFPFVTTGQQSRKEALSHKERVVVAGTVMGYYVFKRSEGGFQSETDEELQRRLMAQLDDGS